MPKHTTTCLIGAMAIGLAATACSPVTEKAEATTTTAPAATTTTTTSTATSDGAAVAPLLPTPADVQQSRGPDEIADGGIHLHYQVNGSPTEVMTAYKNALQSKGWTVTTIITSGGGGGGGATYTGVPRRCLRGVRRRRLRQQDLHRRVQLARQTGKSEL